MCRRFLIIIILILGACILVSNSSARHINSSSEYVIFINHKPHMLYGFYYPLTYKFKSTTSLNNLTVYYKYNISDKWISLKNEGNNSYNGMYCYRVNNSNIYVSVGFKNLKTDYCLLKFVEDNKPVNVSFCGITKYYDNRSCVVTASADDWNRINNIYFEKCCDCFILHHLFLTVGVITQQHTPWGTIQKYVNSGYIEIASHSRTHTPLPYSNYTSEILGSKRDILKSLSLYKWYHIGNHQYVLTWIEPWGECNAKVRELLSKGHYLVDRKYETKNFNNFAGWDSRYHLFKRVGFTIAMQKLRNPTNWSTTNLTLLNQYFDNVSKHHGIYHLMMHPYLVNWTKGSYAWKHLKYISNKSYVWYTPLGILYMYRYGYIGNIIKVQPFNGFAVYINKNVSTGYFTVKINVITNLKIRKMVVLFGGNRICCGGNATLKLIKPGTYKIKLIVYILNNTIYKEYIIHAYNIYPMLYSNNTEINGKIINVTGSFSDIFANFKVLSKSEINIYPVYYNISSRNRLYLYTFIYTKNNTKVNLLFPKSIKAWLIVNNKTSEVYGNNITVYLPKGNNIIKLEKVYSKKYVKENVVYIYIIVGVSLSVLCGMMLLLKKRYMCVSKIKGKYFKKLK